MTYGNYMKFKSINSSKIYNLHVPVVCNSCLSYSGRAEWIHQSPEGSHSLNSDIGTGMVTHAYDFSILNLYKFEASLDYTVRPCL